MLRISERITVSHIKIIVVDVVQEHIDTAEVVSGRVDLLSKEALAYIFFAEDFSKFEKQGTGAAGWVIDLVYFLFANRCNFS